jgi:hypothetical protein
MKGWERICQIWWTLVSQPVLSPAVSPVVLQPNVTVIGDHPQRLLLYFSLVGRK